MADLAAPCQGIGVHAYESKFPRARPNSRTLLVYQRQTISQIYPAWFAHKPKHHFGYDGVVLVAFSGLVWQIFLSLPFLYITFVHAIPSHDTPGYFIITSSVSLDLTWGQTLARRHDKTEVPQQPAHYR